MSDAEIRGWLRLMGDTRAQQLARVRDLLVHANGDRMTLEDRIVCRRALQILGQPWTGSAA